MSVEGELGEFYDELLELFTLRHNCNDGITEGYFAPGLQPFKVLSTSREIFQFVSRALPAPPDKFDTTDDCSTIRVLTSSEGCWPIALPEALHSMMKSQTNKSNHEHPVYFFRGDRFWITWNNHPTVAELHIIDWESDSAIVVICNTSGRIEYAPLWNSISAMLYQRGLLMLHASAVGLPSGGVVIGGGSGCGKSTVSLSCLGFGLQYAGDDVVGVSLKTKRPEGFRVYSTGRYWLKDFEKYPALADLPGFESQTPPKRTVFFPSQFPGLVRSFPLQGFVTTRFSSDRKSLIHPISTIDAFRCFASTSIYRLIVDCHDASKQLFELMASLPCFCLSVGTDSRGIADAVRELVVQLNGEERESLRQ